MKRHVLFAYTGISYCGISLHHIDTDFQQLLFVLGCFPYDGESHSAANTRAFVDDKLSEYGLKLDASKYVVTDNEPKIQAAFRENCCRVGCSVHYLNKQLFHAFESSEIHPRKNVVEKVQCDLAQGAFNSIKKIVSSVRRSHKQQQLSHPLQTYSVTRFNGSFFMMNTFLRVYDEIPNILVHSKLINDFQSVDKQVLQDICIFLESFQETIESLSEDERPTLHRVAPLRQHLLNKCYDTKDDSKAICEMKSFLGKRNFTPRKMTRLFKPVQHHLTEPLIRAIQNSLQNNFLQFSTSHHS